MIIPDMDFFPIPDPDPGSRGSKKHQIPDPDPQHWFVPCLFWFLLLGISLFLPFLLPLSSIFNLYVSLSSPGFLYSKSLCPVCPFPLHLMPCRLVSHFSVRSLFSLPYLLLSLLHISPCPTFCHPCLSLLSSIFLSCLFVLFISLSPVSPPPSPPWTC
jgi:hypothetical protein